LKKRLKINYFIKLKNNIKNHLNLKSIYLNNPLQIIYIFSLINFKELKYNKMNLLNLKILIKLITKY